nr:hypothetical protein [Kandeliimicrobium roseum]
MNQSAATPRSASAMAGAATSCRSIVPQRRSAWSNPTAAPGTVIAR